MLTHVAYHISSSVQRVIDHMCHMRFATLIEKKRGVRDDIKYT